MAERKRRLGSPESVPNQIDSDIRDKLTEYLELKQKEHKNETPTSYKVTVELCQIMKDMHEDGAKATEIRDAMPISSTGTVRYHVNDNCKHNRRSRITYSECGWMRIKAEKGKTTKELSEEYDTNQRIVRKHVTGDCNHESGVDELEGSQLESAKPNKVDRVKSTCPVCGSEFEHRKTEERTTCSKQCNMKYASMKSHGKSPDIASD